MFFFLGDHSIPSMIIFHFFIVYYNIIYLPRGTAILLHRPHLSVRSRTVENTFQSLLNFLRKFVGLPVDCTMVKTHSVMARISEQTHWSLLRKFAPVTKTENNYNRHELELVLYECMRFIHQTAYGVNNSTSLTGLPTLMWNKKIIIYMATEA